MELLVTAFVPEVTLTVISFSILRFGLKQRRRPSFSSAFDAASERLDEIAAGKSEGNHGR
jgi:hypothetical protein